MVSFNKYYTSYYGLLILGVGLEESEAPLLRDSQHLSPCQTHLTPGLRLKDTRIHLGRFQLGAKCWHRHWKSLFGATKQGSFHPMLGLLVYTQMAFPEDCKSVEILMVTQKCLPHSQSLSLIDTQVTRLQALLISKDHAHRVSG